MFRSLSILAALLASGALLLSAPAWACGEGGCACQGHKAKKTEVKDSKSSDLTEKCKCGSPAECTCKKGECKCPKCGGKQGQIIESLRGVPDPLVVPAEARRNASAGVFI